jgi:hypothetical protein
MPISIQIEEETGIAIATGSGVLRLNDAQEAAAALWQTPGWAGRSALWDFRGAEFDVSSSETREIAQFILQNQPTPPPSKIAFVAQRDVDFGMARMFEVHREDPATAFRVFRDYDEAIRWSRSLEPDAA